MSGGSYNYAYSRISELADSIREHGNCSAATPALRKAFAAHLRDCAEACRAIEWNDSCDGDDREVDLIRKCIAPDAALMQAISDAKEAQDALAVEIALAEEQVK